jgi:hypothetical protein
MPTPHDTSRRPTAANWGPNWGHSHRTVLNTVRWEEEPEGHARAPSPTTMTPEGARAESEPPRCIPRTKFETTDPRVIKTDQPVPFNSTSPPPTARSRPIPSPPHGWRNRRQLGARPSWNTVRLGRRDFRHRLRLLRLVQAAFKVDRITVAQDHYKVTTKLPDDPVDPDTTSSSTHPPLTSRRSASTSVNG